MWLIFFAVHIHISPHCLINCHYPAKCGERRRGVYLMFRRLSPQRTVNHQTSIRITNEGPHVALGVRGENVQIYGNALICSRVQAIAEKCFFCSDDKGRWIKAGLWGGGGTRQGGEVIEGGRERFLPEDIRYLLFNLDFYRISHTALSRWHFLDEGFFKHIHTHTHTPSTCPLFWLLQLVDLQ